eukprot:TRINITY_DN850_c0_g1_i1.p1 TRINITY_DN850_c0_g1~~TRINITY_DN850_c0_g1_i1.p1  ORF type:complete len:2505 (+),score=855.68 TRINITY_DN850_c0_g1_i1:97-7515(+)
MASEQLTVDSSASQVNLAALSGSSDSPSQLASLFTLLRGLEPRPGDVFSIHKVILLGVLIEVVQPVAFVLNPHIAWSQDWLGGVAHFFQLASLWDPELHGVGRYVAVGVFFAAVAFLSVTWALLGYVLKSKTDHQGVLSATRTCVHALTVPLLVPVLQVLLSQMVCNGDHLWLFEDAECWVPLHIFCFSLGLLCCIGLAVTALIVLTTVYDNDALSLHPAARAHTRVDRWYVYFKIAAAVSFHALLARGMQQSYCWIMFTLSVAMAAAFAAIVPYYSLRMLRLRLASLLSLSWGCLVGFILHKDEGGDHFASEDTALVVFLAPLPVVWLLAWFLGGVRLSRSCQKDFRRVLTGKEPLAHCGFPLHLPEHAFAPSTLQEMQRRFLEFDMYAAQGSEYSAQTTGSRPSVLTPYIDSVNFPSDVELATRNLLLWHQHFLTHPTGAMLAVASQIYAKGVSKFPHSPIVRIHLSMFLVRYLEGSSLAVSWLAGLEHVDSIRGDLASRYVVFRMSTQLKTQLGIRDRSHLQALATARRYHREALEHMSHFWGSLCDKENLNLMALAMLANNITSRGEHALASFSSVLSQHSQDVQILTFFSEFLIQVLLDQEAHDKCREEIDTLLESKRSKRQARSADGTSMVQSTIATTNRGGAGVSKAVQAILAQVESKETGANSGSRTVQVVKGTILLVFSPLALLLIAFLLLTYFYSKGHERLLEQTQSSGKVRLLGQYAAMVLQQLRHEAQQQGSTGNVITGGGVSTGDVLKDKLAAIAQAFAAHHNKLTFGGLMPSQADLQDYYKKPELPYKVYATSAVAEYRVIGLWSLGNALYTAMLVLGTIPSEQMAQIQDSPYTNTLLNNMDGPVADAFNRTAAHLESASAADLGTTNVVAVVLFVAAVIMVYVVDLAFVWNFNKIGASKVSTLELFTLIPDATLRATAAEAREKLAGLDKESDGRAAPQTLYEGPDDASSNSEPEPEDPGSGEQQRTLSDSQQLQAMTAQEALKSLDERRKNSVIACVLAKGVEEQKLLDEELARSHRSERQLGASTSRRPPTALPSPRTGEGESERDPEESEAPRALGKGGQAREAHIPQDNAMDAGAADADAAEAAQAAEEVDDYDPGSEPPPVWMLVLAMLVLLGLLIAGTSVAFTAYRAHIGQVEEDARAAVRLALQLSDLMEAQVVRARDFAQFAQLSHSALYWGTENRAEEQAVQVELHRLGLTEGEVDLLIDITEAGRRLHHFNCIAMKLMGDFEGIPTSSMPELRHPKQPYSWGPLNVEEPALLRRLGDSRVRPPPPYTATAAEPIRHSYTYTDSKQDDELPDRVTGYLFTELGTQRTRVHTIYVQAARRLGYLDSGNATAAERALGVLRAELASFAAAHRALSEQPGLESETLSDAYTRISGQFDALHSGARADLMQVLLLPETYSAANTYEEEISSVLAVLEERGRKGIDRLFAEATNRDELKATYLQEVSALEAIRGSRSAGERVLRGLARLFMLEATASTSEVFRAQDSLQQSFQRWQPADVSLDGWSYRPGAAEQSIRMQAASAIAGNASSSAAHGAAEALEVEYSATVLQAVRAVPGAGTRSLLLMMKGEIARATLFSDAYEAEVDAVRKRLLQLRRRLGDRTGGELDSLTRDQEDSVVHCIILFAIAAALASWALLCFRVWWLAALLLFAAAAAGVAAQIPSAIEDLEIAHERLGRLALLGNGTAAEGRQSRTLTQAFAQFADGLAYEEYWEREAAMRHEQLEREVVDVATFDGDTLAAAASSGSARHSPKDLLATLQRRVADSAELAEQSAEEGEQLRAIERTAIALSAAANNLVTTGRLEFPRAMQEHYWNFSAEASYQSDVLRYNGPLDAPGEGTLKYTDPVGDLQCSNCGATAQDKARAVTSSLKHAAVRRAQQAAIERVITAAVRRWESILDDARSDIETYTVVTIIIGCVGIAVSVGVLLAVVSRSLQQGSGAGNQVQDQMNKQLFTTMTRKIRLALLAVVALVTLLFAVSYMGQQATDGAVRSLNLASARQWLVARANLVAQGISSVDATVARRQADIRSLTQEMQRVNDELYFGDDSGKYGLVARDSQLDELLFGPTASGAAVRAARYVPCGPDGGASEAALGPVNVRYLSHLSKLNAVAYHPDNSNADRDRILALVEELKKEADEVIQGLEEASSRFKDVSVSKAGSNIVFCSIIVGLTIGLVLAEYRFIFLPMLSQLAAEEDGTKLMLNMIPADVRESVPEIAEYFSTGRVSEEEKIKKQLQQSEKLLQNILPPAIARRLKAGESPIADDHTAITVAFCACVGFDEISRGMSAHAVVNFLNELFTKFDEITDRLDLEKIKTIGDIYFMCGGLTEKTSQDHALRVMDAVLCFFEALEEHKVRYDAHSLTMKAGVNTGPAVAGVIGSKKVAYDLWGDAVNVSSRLCGTGIDGKVSVNPGVKEMVASHFSFKERWVEAKGKGRLQTFVLEARTQPSAFASTVATY